MARTAAETANILREIYDDGFSGEESEPYRLGWDQLRGIAGVGRLTDEVIAELGKLMLDRFRVFPCSVRQFSAGRDGG